MEATVINPLAVLVVVALVPSWIVIVLLVAAAATSGRPDANILVRGK